MEELAPTRLDKVDRRILDLLQREGALSVAEVASRTGLSTTTCWRRIQALEQSGVIKGRVALLDIHAAVREFRGVRVSFDYRIARSSDGRTLVEGHTAHAFVDSSGKVVRPPERFRAALEAKGSIPEGEGE